LYQVEGAFNLSLILRKMLGAGTPRQWKNRAARVLVAALALSAGPLEGRFADPAAPSRCRPTQGTIVALPHLVTPAISE
jgi:hypothetical protein